MPTAPPAVLARLFRRRIVLVSALVLAAIVVLALGAVLIAMSYWRRTKGFWRHAYTANVILMTLGFVLTGYQLVGYFIA